MTRSWTAAPLAAPGQSFKVAVTDDDDQPRTFRVRVPDDHSAGQPLRVPLYRERGKSTMCVVS